MAPKRKAVQVDDYDDVGYEDGIGYEMVGTIIATKKDITWLVDGYPDYGGFRAPVKPAALHNVRVLRRIKL